MNPAIILEQTSYIRPADVEILEQQDDTIAGINKVTFRARLQTAEERNQNQRYYRKDICKDIVDALRPKALSRSLFQEVDHPLVIPSSTDDTISLKKRAITIEIKNSGTLIKDIYMRGNDVIGEIETLSGFRGPDIYNLIVNDKANIGFSLRMFGRLVPDPRTGVNIVERPLRPITYDIVSNPSHQSAKILDFLPEDINYLKDCKGSSCLCESDMMLLENEDIHFADNESNVDSYIKLLIEECYTKTRIVKFYI